MSSEGTGSPISQQDAIDLLHKLMTESTKVQGVFISSVGRVRASMTGVIRVAPDDTFWVVEPGRVRGPMLAFDPTHSVVRKYGDERALLDGGETPFGFRFRSSLWRTHRRV